MFSVSCQIIKIKPKHPGFMHCHFATLRPTLSRSLRSSRYTAELELPPSSPEQSVVIHEISPHNLQL